MPRRRCVGCGRIAPKTELWRLAATDRRSAGEGENRSRHAVLDRAATMPGRGAYLCRAGVPAELAADCLVLATRRGALARALRCAVKIDPELLESIRRWRSQPPDSWPKRGLAPQARVTRLRSGPSTRSIIR